MGSVILNEVKNLTKSIRSRPFALLRVTRKGVCATGSYIKFFLRLDYHDKEFDRRNNPLPDPEQHVLNDCTKAKRGVP